MPAIPKIKIGNTEYDVKDAYLRDNAFVDRGELPQGTDVDTITDNGQWWISSSVVPTLTNWPSEGTGRLLVFGNTNAGSSIKIQMVLTNRDEFLYRYLSGSGWNRWSSAGLNHYEVTSTPESGSIFTDLNTFPKNSLVMVGTIAVALDLANKPDLNTNGFVITIARNQYNFEPDLQIYFARKGGAFAYRTGYLVNGAETWSDWAYHGEVTDKYLCAMESREGVNFVNLAWGIRYMMQNFNKWSPHHRCEIEIEAGTYSLSSAISYISDGTLDTRGLFVTPYCHIHGAGKDKTILELMYNGDDANTMYNVSALNITYECLVEDLTIKTKNLRYTIHSDNGISNMPDITVDNDKLMNNNQITLKNVKLIHEGFEDGKTPAQNYKVPSCWGSGSYNNANQTFIDCDFIAAQCTPWLNHNRSSLTDPSRFEFENCTFVNGNQAEFSTGNDYTSCLFISWGSGLKDKVIFKNCKVNRFVTLSVRTDMGNTHAICDYDVVIDNDLPIIEYKANDSHLLDNYKTANIQVGFCTQSGGITAYKPVTVSMRYGVKNYDASLTGEEYEVGVSTCSAGNLEGISYQNKGIIYLPLITSATFSSGQEIGYENNAWSASASRKIIKVINQYLGRIIAN